MNRAGLIVNPMSGQAGGKGPTLARMVGADGRIGVRILDDFAKLPVHLKAFAEEGVTDLCISSGDGTIQAIQTELAERNPFAALPRLILLPHGTTNMTAGDLGFRRRSLAAQADFLANPEIANPKRRPSLRAVNPRDGKVRHGMFLGTGAIAEATRFCQTAFNAKGVTGSWATFATLAGAVLRTVFSKPDPADRSRFDRPFPIRVECLGQTVANGSQLLMLATTLEKLILGTRPFWGDRAGPIRATVVPYPVPSVARWLWPMLYGSEDRKVPDGARSLSARSLAVSAPGSFVIDGEFFEAPVGGALQIETGPTFTFITG